MTKQELRSRQEEYKRSDNRLAMASFIVFFGSWFGFVALLPVLGPEMKRTPWVGPVVCLGFFGSMIVQLILLLRMAKWLRKKHGVACPQCDNPLTGLGGHIAMATGNCGGCGLRVIEDTVHDPNGESNGLSTVELEAQAREDYRVTALKVAPWLFFLGITFLCLSLLWSPFRWHTISLGMTAGLISIGGGLLSYHTTWKWAPWALTWVPTMLLWQLTSPRNTDSDSVRAAIICQFTGMLFAVTGAVQWAFGLRLHRWMKAIQARRSNRTKQGS